MRIKSSFQPCTTKPGHGEVVLSNLPPSIPTLTTLSFKYPLKLLTDTPRYIPRSSVLLGASQSVYLYILTYGGGLLPGDEIAVSITLNPQTRLVLTTPQGSNKIYRTEPKDEIGDRLGIPAHERLDMSRQILDVRIRNQAALCYLPDPNIPFRDSRYEQIQTFTVDTGDQRGSLCVLDWVTEGRTAQGENWDFNLWRGKNEVWALDAAGKKLVLRDSIILDADVGEHGAKGVVARNLIRECTGGNSVMGTLILYGPVFERLASFLMDRFTSLPRIGACNWLSSSTSSESPSAPESDVTWTAARVRACFLLKFGARDVDLAKQWLGDLLREEGSIPAEFGHRALHCL